MPESQDPVLVEEGMVMAQDGREDSRMPQWRHILEPWPLDCQQELEKQLATGSLLCNLR